MTTPGSELILFKGQKSSPGFASLPRGDSLADGIGSGYGIIGYKGKNWTLRYKGQTYNFVRPDDGTPISYIDVVILKSASQKSKSYYAGYDQDTTGARPICASLDGIKPDSDVQQAQATACALCPRNQWKTREDGRKAKECADYKRLAVLLLPTQTTAMLGSPLMEPVFLRVPAASLTHLASYGSALDAQGYHYTECVTRVSFDPAKAHPEFQFKGIQLLTAAEEPVVVPLVEDALTKRIIGETNPLQLNAPAVNQQQLPAGQPVSTGFAQIGTQANVPQPPARPIQEAEIIPPSHPPVSGAFGVSTNGGGSAPKVATPPLKALTKEDTGAVQEADEDLDARINALMGKA